MYTMGKLREGDAVWVVPHTEVVTAPARKSALQLFGYEALAAACEQALADFAQPGGPYQDAEALAEAQAVIREIHEKA